MLYPLELRALDYVAHFLILVCEEVEFGSGSVSGTHSLGG